MDMNNLSAMEMMLFAPDEGQAPVSAEPADPDRIPTAPEGVPVPMARLVESCPKCGRSYDPGDCDYAFHDNTVHAKHREDRE